jgi:hypothetical protein
MHEMIILTWSDYCADCQTHAMLHTVTVQNVQITKYFWMRTENKFAKKKNHRDKELYCFKSVKGCTATKAKLGPIAAATNKIRPRREMDGGRCGHCFSHPFLPFFLCRQAPVSRMLLRAVIKFLISCNDRKWRVASSASLESHLAAPRPVPHVVCR